MINRTTLFAYLRKAPFGGRLTQEQVDGVESILGAMNNRLFKDLRHVAYILATAFHETGGKMIPVREGFADSDAKARKIVARRKYGKPDPVTGHVYYGRGHVQLTWAENYATMGRLLSEDLVGHPDLALDPDISAEILVEGMTKGLSTKGDFTGKCVENYFNDTTNDPVGARAVVNGRDKAQLIATYHKAFLDALKAASTDTPQPADVEPEDAEPDGGTLFKDKTTLGGIGAMISTGGLGFLTAIDNPWAVVAVGIVAIAVILFLTGRLEIRRKAGA
jgi:putative chitinase